MRSYWRSMIICSATLACVLAFPRTTRAGIENGTFDTAAGWTLAGATEYDPNETAPADSTGSIKLPTGLASSLSQSFECAGADPQGLCSVTFLSKSAGNGLYRFQYRLRNVVTGEIEAFRSEAPDDWQ